MSSASAGGLRPGPTLGAGPLIWRFELSDARPLPGPVWQWPLRAVHRPHPLAFRPEVRRAACGAGQRPTSVSHGAWRGQLAPHPQAFSRASRQYPVLAHGPITVTCTRRNHADEIETPLAVPTCPEPFAGCRSAGGGLSAASDELRPHSIYAHSLDLRSPVGVTRWEFLAQGHSGILSSRYNGDIFLERPREPVARWRETALRGLFTNHMQVYEVLCE